MNDIATVALPEPQTDDNVERAMHWFGLMQSHGKTTVEAAANLGEVLIEQRDLCGQKRGGSGFSQWIDDNLPFSRRSAMNYISIAEHWDELGSALPSSDEPGSIREAMKRIEEITKPAPAPVDDNNTSDEPVDSPAENRHEPGTGDDGEGFYESNDGQVAEPQVDLVKEYDSPVKSFVRQIGKLQTDFAVLQDENEFTRHFYNSIVAEDFRQRLNNAKNVVTAHRPHVVCPHCDAEGCEECGDSGVLTRGLADKVL